MNKFIIIALVAFAGVASANLHKGFLKNHGSRHQQLLEGDDFGEFEPHQGRFHDGEEDYGHSLRHGFDEPRLGGYQGEFGHGLRQGAIGSGIGAGLEGSRLGHQGGFHHGSGKFIGHKGGRLGRRQGINRNGGFSRHPQTAVDYNDFGLNRHGSEFSGIGGGHGGRRHGGRVGRHGGRLGGVGGAGIGAGVIGGARAEKSIEGGVGSSTHLGSNTGIEGHQGASIEGEGHFDAGKSHDEHNDLEGSRKHQVINKDKTIIKDKTTGVNDVDTIRHLSGSHDDSHLGAGLSASAQENAGASLNSQKEFDHDFGAGGSAEGSLEAAGAAGIGAAGVGGAGFN